MPNPIQPGRPPRRPGATAPPGHDRPEPSPRRGGDGFEGSSASSIRVLGNGVALTGAGLALEGATVESSRFDDPGETQRLYRLGERLLAQEKNPFEGRSIGSRRRAAVVEQLGPFLIAGREATGRPNKAEIRGRSAAFALLVRTAQAMDNEGESPARERVVDQLLAAAQKEPFEPLQRQMLLGLDSLKRQELSASQRAQRKVLTEGLCPSRPPYESWFGDNPKPSLKVRQVVMDEFWKKEIADYRKRGYQVDVHSKHRATATKTVKDPAGKYPDTRVTVDLVEGARDVLQGMDDEDVQVVLYTGHSQLGGVARHSLDSGPKKAKGDKLVGFFACRGKQWVGELGRRYPDSHRLVSNRGTYGHDDRIVIHELIDGICARRSYSEMGRRAEAQELWETDNYFLPHDRRALASMDLDSDGKAAISGKRRDLLYSPQFGARSGRAKSFKPSTRPVDLEKVDSAPLQEAVSWFNTEFNYWAQDFGNAKDQRLADRFHADGWFKSDDPDEIVRISTDTDDRGKTIARIQMNASYASHDKDALAMLLTHGAAMELGRRHDPGQSEHELRMRSLAMVGSYVSYVKPYSEDSEVLVENFCKRFDYPATVDVDVLERAVLSDHDHEASPKVLKRLEKNMQGPFREVRGDRSDPAFRARVTKALDLLRGSDSDIGRRTFEAIASGRVRIDSLADLTRADYQRLGREYERAGVELPVKRYESLGDRRVLRGLESDLDGYMWDNRIYVAEGLGPKRMATTLVHEVNHVINRSEENYRGHTNGLMEEYRAHYAEALFEGREMSPEACATLKREIMETYGFDRADLTKIPDQPPGQFLP